MARFAAIQALYQIELSQGDPADVIAEFKAHRLSDLLEPLEEDLPKLRVDHGWFAVVTRGAAEQRDKLDGQIAACLAEGWTLERIGFVSRALLRAGAFELAERLDVPSSVVVNEYVEVAHAFFEGNEPAFINAVLDRLSKRLRGNGAGPA